MSGKLSCLIAAAALIVMITAVIINAIYVKNTTNYILMLINDPDGSVFAISQYWDERIPKLKLTLSQKELEDISLNINEAIICAEKQDDEEYTRNIKDQWRACGAPLRVSKSVKNFHWKIYFNREVYTQ